MRTIKVFVDTSTVNRILDVEESRPENLPYEEDRKYLPKILENYVNKDIVQLFVNPSVKLEIENTPDPQRRGQLLDVYNQFHFTSHNKTIFGFSFSAIFVKNEEELMLEELRTKIKDFDKDAKPFLDAVSNSQIEVLLTTDREHLANEKLRNFLRSKGLDKKVKVFTPKEFFEYLEKGRLEK